MTEFIAGRSSEAEATWRKYLSYFYAQVSVGKATTGALVGLAVSQTGTASASVLIGAGAGVIQAATNDGASPAINDTQKTLNVLTGAPMGGLARWDVVVFDATTDSIRAITGTPSATPSYPTVPTSCLPLAGLRHAASATTIPTAAIDDLRVFTRMVGTLPKSTITSRTSSYGVGAGVLSPVLLTCPMPDGDASTRYRVLCTVPGFSSTVAADRVEVILYDGAGTQCGAQYVNVAAGVGGGGVFGGQISAPAAAGNVTMKVASLGTGTVTVRGVEGWTLEVVPA